MTFPEARTHSDTHPPGAVPPDVAAWAATVPAGTTGTASALLPLYLASGAPPRTCYGPPWSPNALGMALTKLCARAASGVSRVRNRTGTAVYTFAGPRAAA